MIFFPNKTFLDFWFWQCMRNFYPGQSKTLKLHSDISGTTWQSENFLFDQGAQLKKEESSGNSLNWTECKAGIGFCVFYTIRFIRQYFPRLSAADPENLLLFYLRICLLAVNFLKRFTRMMTFSGCFGFSLHSTMWRPRNR